MKSTIELLTAATDRTNLSERALSTKLGHSPWTLSRGKLRGSLSPIVAGQLAEIVGESIERWMAIAAIESEPRSRVTDHLRKAITQARNS